jgi:hypothetical protein
MWVDDRPHGHGIMIFVWGTRYEGEWANGCESGLGTVLYWNDNYFTGIFEDGEETGDICKAKPTLVTALEFDDIGIPTKGILVYKSGARYQGYLDSEGYPSGPGILEAPTGVTWKGEFLGGRFHGDGMSTRPGGGIMKGIWTQQLGNGPFEDINDKPGGGRYIGELQDTTRHGIGMLETTSYVYEGEFRKNEMHGLGTRTYSNGDVYTGLSANGAMNGHGKMVYGSGTTFDGNWENNKKQGTGQLTFRDGKSLVGRWTQDMAKGGQFSFPELKITHSNGIFDHLD